MARSNAYKFTVTSMEDPAIALLKHDAKVENLIRRLEEARSGTVHRSEWGGQEYVRRVRVRVRARLGKDSPYAHLYRRGGKHYRWTSQDIRPEHGSRFDVYVHDVFVWKK